MIIKRLEIYLTTARLVFTIYKTFIKCKQYYNVKVFTKYRIFPLSILIYNFTKIRADMLKD